MAPNRRPKTVTRKGRTLVAFEEDPKAPGLIAVGEEDFPGPFCRNCGNPFTLHEDDLACVERLHPVFPIGDFTMPYVAHFEHGAAVQFSTPLDLTNRFMHDRIVRQINLVTNELNKLERITKRTTGKTLWEAD